LVLLGGVARRLAFLGVRADRQAHRKDRTFARFTRHGHVAAQLCGYESARFERAG
jgi:hypothetical protein